MTQSAFRKEDRGNGGLRWSQKPCASRIWMVSLVLLACAGSLLAQEPASLGNPHQAVASQPTAAAEANPGNPPVQYMISPGDTVDVSVFDVPELSRSYTVSPSGTIDVPLLPQPVQATGLTPDELARSLEEAFRQSGRLQRPEISVALKQSFGNSVAVQGDVKSPQMISTLVGSRLADILTQCGGVADETAEATATVTRGSLGLQALAKEGKPAEPTLKVDVKKVMNPSDPASQIYVWPGDRVVVQSLPPVYYVLGEVKAPGGYTFKYGQDEMTLLRAVALAGDMTSLAKRKKVYVIRKDPTAAKGHKEIEVNIASVLKGKTPDLRVHPEDIIFVPGSNAKKALQLIQNSPSIIAATAVNAAIIR